MAFKFIKPKEKLTWLITGCSSGFGLSLTRIALDNGHTVIATSRNPSRTPELVAEVESKGGRWLKLDVNDHNSPEVIEELERSGLEVDVLVNNAGYSILVPVELATEDEIRGQMETMYFGPLRLIRAVVPHMRKRRFGAIVNISSGASLEGRETMGPYAGAKAGLDGITKVLAQEVAPYNIRTLTVVPGAFNTNIANATMPGKKPMPDDYKGSVSDMILQVLAGADIPGIQFALGDKDKGMKAVYEVVVGEGIGAGRESEPLLLLGSDMTARAKSVQKYLGHALETFKDVTNYVDIA
ncbi:putative short-chain oxidoreductase [Daldinia caldariorum]|uniref:putative short-chain oxidoreductase n=1 Tax=Daldinia caldariorum TaxID=326644 RepID=UPI00200788E6|nr:putative short-chain oxidoreductase [Daldinia caldariorum]KAI1463027.1 putative short-chain oxidoreductase [Daldinia caldariorum]